jgi:Ni,Fe-hydrogenase III large subunit/Ni,Fe-hydrogenase III component G
MAILDDTRTHADPRVARLRHALGRRLLGVAAPARGRLYVTVERDALRDAAAALWDDPAVRYVISIGSDRRAQGEGFEAMHVFAVDADALRIAVRARLDAAEPSMPSITPVVPAASWAELEMRDLFGIVPDGHPDPRRLVLPDGFPEGVHPLRKDVPHDLAWEDDGTTRGYRPPPAGASVVQLGPFFPVLEEPSQWRVFVDGERVVGCDYRGFFCHRAIEKLGDSQLGWNQVIQLAERICGICGCVHSTSYCQAVEEAAGIDVPLRARVVRTVMLELERLQSHLLWLGLAGHVVGFDFVFMQSWRLREPLMDLAERLCGSRKHFGVNLVGGTTFDLDAARCEALLEAVGTVERAAGELAGTLEGDEVLVSRLQGVGVLTRDEVRLGGLVGPTARASGVPIDVRRDHPYAAYPHLRFEVCVEEGGDVWARTRVRIREIFQAVQIVRQCVRMLGELPPGEIMAAVPESLPAGLEGLGAVEAPRGEVFHYVRSGERHGPERWRVRAPSYQNIQFTPWMFKPGTTIADVPISVASADPCFSCTERVELVDPAGGGRRLRGAELEALCRADMAARRARAAGRTP